MEDKEKDMNLMLLINILHETHKAFQEGNNTQFFTSHNDEQVIFVVVGRENIDDEKEMVRSTITNLDWDTAVFNAYTMLMHASFVADKEEMKMYVNELCERFPGDAAGYIKECQKSIETITTHRR